MKRIISVIISIPLLLMGNNTNAQHQFPSEFLPDGYTVFDTVDGDLNHDGLEDHILIIKATDKKAIIQDEFRGELDRNRRGIIVLLNKGNHYVLASQNNDCFSSENEDGGAYIPPELWVNVKEGNLNIYYFNNKYGFFSYTFRFQDNNFVLIGYDASHSNGPIISKEVSINFLTKKQFIKENINADIDVDEEVFKETWRNIEVEELTKLSEIKDFHELYLARGY